MAAERSGGQRASLLASCLSVPSKRLNLWLLVGREYLDKYSKYANSFIFILLVHVQEPTLMYLLFNLQVRG